MLDDNFGFRDDEERKEFYIALPIIALFGGLLYYFVFASDDKASLATGATATAAFIDSDADGIADHLDRCADETGTLENHGCLTAQTSEEAPVAKSQPKSNTSNKQTLATKAQPENTSDSAEATKVNAFQQVELLDSDTPLVAADENADATADAEDADADADADRNTDAADADGIASDKDSDGVPDDTDACPDQAGDNNGCPADKDGDGIPDDSDDCPDQAGDNNGCPADKDADGVPDDADNCPDEAGTEDGCPASTEDAATSEDPVTNSEEQMILDAGINIQFNAGNAVLVDESREILLEVALVMRRNPDIKLEAHGFTDSSGSAESNKDLSQRRAQACIDVLIEAGIEPERLSAIGFGEDQPIATNDTAEGREKNRRVEFKLIP